MDGKAVLVLGGGVGGLVSASLLKQKVGGQTTVRLIERKRQFQFAPSFPWLMIGSRRPDQIQRDLDKLREKGIDVIKDEVISIDPQSKAVRTENNEFPYDFLVIPLGAEYAPNTIPGFERYAHHIMTWSRPSNSKKLLKD